MSDNFHQSVLGGTGAKSSDTSDPGDAISGTMVMAFPLMPPSHISPIPDTLPG